MKSNRKTYNTPLIDRVLLDKDISLVMISPPGGPSEVPAFPSELIESPMLMG